MDNTSTATTTTSISYGSSNAGYAPKDNEPSPLKRTAQPFTPDSINAERFIPQHKRVQWDIIPSNIIVSVPSRQTKTIDPLLYWIYIPANRRSQFDGSTINLLNYIYDCVQYLEMCYFSHQSPIFGRQMLSSYSNHIQQQYQVILQNQAVVKGLESKLTFFSELETAQPNIEAIIESNRSSGTIYTENRAIQTTPESLAKVCDEIQSLMDGCHGADMTDSDAALQLKCCQEMVCKDYLSKMHMLMDIERLQANEDMTAYDMYSLQFEYIEIPHTQSTVKKCQPCFNMKKNAGKRVMRNVASWCAYHSNLMQSSRYSGVESLPKLEQSQGYNKASIVRSRSQFNVLKAHLSEISEYRERKDQKIIGYLKVPGIAENRPLVSVGDLLRLRFGSEEVLAEVGAMTIKTETIMLFLPLPSKWRCSPMYLTGLMNPKNLPREFLGRHGGSAAIGRFDIRFGLFSSRAHDIFKEVFRKAVVDSFDQIVRVVAPTPFLKHTQKKSVRRPHLGIAEWAHDLNAEQKHAVFDIVRKNHGEAPYIIYGPPGTGKTMTVCESIVQLLRYDSAHKILVTAPSDAACDVIAKRLIPVLPGEILRVNWWSRNPDSLPPSLLTCSAMDENGFFYMPTIEEIMNASVVLCQCFVAGCLEIGTPTSRLWMENHFTHVFIDESSQSFEFESLIPLFKVGSDCSIILAGDPKQLGPTTRSSCASSNGLCLSLQERLMGLSLYQSDSDYSVITKLFDNYRSHDALLRVPSELFYSGSLRCKASAEVTSVCKNFELLRDGDNFPMMVYDVHDGREQNKIDTPSFYNLEECRAVVKIIKALLSSDRVDISAGQIAVITCFRAQVLKMRAMLREEGFPTVNVGVVEDFQGQETSVVLISTVLTRDQTRWMSGAKSGLGFMTDPKRFNVAITRASALCVIVGKLEYLEASGSYWTSLIEHIRRNDNVSGGSKLSEEEEKVGLVDYGIDQLISRVSELKLLGSGHEFDRYQLAMRGYYEDAPEWKVCL